ncbi:MAG: glycosyltransferase [Nitrospirota bacterium]|nr:glycosyltransferase [Nitrospirota bacterium]
MATPRVSVIIRCKNEVADIGGVLCAVASQKVDFAYEVIAVDSGSTDGTLELLKNFSQKFPQKFPLRVIQISPASFTFGYSLNVGCEAAKGDVLLALSAHVYPRHSRWLAAHARHFSDPRVAATCVGEKTAGVIHQDAAAFLANPHAGCDSANGGYRAELWRRRPFHETLSGAEDKEWGYHFQKQGYLVVLDPEVRELHKHVVNGSRALIRDRHMRSFREHRAFAEFLPKRVLVVSLLRRLLKKGLPRNRESLAWYGGAIQGIFGGKRQVW